MKKLLLIFIAATLTSCSFDNKTGLWKDATNTQIDNQTTKSISDNNLEKRYEDVFLKGKIFNEEKKQVNVFNIKIDDPVNLVNWIERYAVPTNNISNFFYKNNKKLISKSSKLSKLKSNNKKYTKNILFYKNNLISYDHKGRIFIYSLSLGKKVFEYNFYKKNFKKFNKEINLIINENILYAADNLGYLYAINLDNNSILWAKNYGIPFRSNLKFANNQIFAANQDNLIYSFNIKNGEKNWQFATALTFLKSDFKNNLVLDVLNNNLIFLNTSGELYSLNYLTQKINWILNFKKTSLVEDTELFLSHPLVIKNDNLIITTEKSVLSYNIFTASRNWSLASEPIFKPIITLDYTYVILKNNLLICLDNTSGKVIWSKNIFKNTINKKGINKFSLIADFKIVNNEINIYSKNGYLLSFNLNDGNLNYFSRISKNGINSEIIFLDSNMLFVDSDNKLLKFN
jgi:outer membrane protein assembly factor BamB